MDIGQVQYIWTMILSDHIGREGGALEFDHYLKGKEIIYPQKSKNLNRFTILKFHI